MLKPISSPQKGVGSVAVPASCCAVQHEGEKHQEGSDTHPQNQPEPRASREKSKRLSLCLSSPLLINFFRFLMQDLKIEPLPRSTLQRFSPLSTLRPFVELDLEC